MNIMTKRGSLDNVVTYEHYCDTHADLDNIPASQITLGSIAIVLKDDGDALGVYMASSQKEWFEITSAMGGGGGSAIAADFIHICASDEYDSDTKVPTVESPEENTFYLVPNAGNEDDSFDEWIWVNEGWEKFGVGKIGETGTTFIPTVSAEGVISWTNDGGQTNPASVNLVNAVLNALPVAAEVSF